MSSAEQQASASKYTDTSEFALWDKYESVAMHFNELLIRLRTQALGGLTGIVALSGLAINFAQRPESKAQWEILFGTLLFFALAWVALWILDLCYYNPLLQGAVDALVAHESRTPTLVNGGDKSINLSTKILNRVPNYTRYIKGFYSVVLAGLVLGIAYTFYQVCTWQRPPHEPVQYRVHLTHPDALQIVVEHKK
jgi:hypothetical protein